MRIGLGVVIQKDCWLNIAHQRTEAGPMIAIGDGTNIGRRCTISAANSISMGNHVLIAPNVFITDHNHEYRDINIPIMHQGITTPDGQVSIGDGTWIGINAVIMGNVTVGKQCVIGSNAVLNRAIPDYCIAVGNPARVVKMYTDEQWVSIKNNEELRHYLKSREPVHRS